MGMKTKFKDFFFGEEEEYVEEITEETPEEPRSIKKSSQKQNVVSLQSIQQSSKMVLMEPRMYAEAQEIADHLKSHRAVVVNLQRISKDQAKRIVDFLSGTVYAIGGDIQRVGTDIFLCTPDNIEVSGNITDLIQED
ncbi:cell division protein SepF [Jeotgalibacillus alimentarius]|uniref:Cell division protein SepF n=2 Tax=Jeotgalibacillus TaxID=157226 RepID=A0A0C2S8U5_9BACL|nr:MULTISPECIES: cell division protein SepF [Jeotgalibacillus]KIL50394.1 cell division protein SepF [Jeotgalibacillus alimentarius]MBM7578423.1 cell division inhibitor SepF [Jeotgalibacillus terrae]